MNALSIKDLAVTEELDSRAMSAVRGGTMPLVWNGFNTSSLDYSSSVAQMAQQTQNTSIFNGNNTAFSGDAVTYSNPVQKATIINH